MQSTTLHKNAKFLCRRSETCSSSYTVPPSPDVLSYKSMASVVFLNKILSCDDVLTGRKPGVSFPHKIAANILTYRKMLNYASHFSSNLRTFEIQLCWPRKSCFIRYTKNQQNRVPSFLGVLDIATTTAIRQ